MGGSVHRDGHMGSVGGWRRTPKGTEGEWGGGATLSLGHLDANNIASDGGDDDSGGNEHTGGCRCSKEPKPSSMAVRGVLAAVTER